MSIGNGQKVLPIIYPLEWHPWYRDKTWLLDWLNGDGAYRNREIRLPISPPLRRVTLQDLERDPAEADELTIITMTKHQMQAPAPYVGKPFVYVWTVGIDELGRGIAGDSERLYREPWHVP